MTKVFLVKLMYFSISTIIFFFIVIIYIYIYITFTFSQFYILESKLGYRRYINIVYLICLLHYLKAVEIETLCHLEQLAFHGKRSVKNLAKLPLVYHTISR